MWPIYNFHSSDNQCNFHTHDFFNLLKLSIVGIKDYNGFSSQPFQFIYHVLSLYKSCSKVHCTLNKYLVLSNLRTLWSSLFYILPIIYKIYTQHALIVSNFFFVSLFILLNVKVKMRQLGMIMRWNWVKFCISNSPDTLKF